jgi:hypothetical protein
MVGNYNSATSAGTNAVVHEGGVGNDFLCPVALAASKIVSSEGLESFARSHGVATDDFVVLVESYFQEEDGAKRLCPIVLALFQQLGIESFLPESIRMSRGVC